MDAFVDLEVVVGGQERNCFVDFLVVKDGIGNGIQRTRGATRWRNYQAVLIACIEVIHPMRLTPCIAFESSIFALASVGCSWLVLSAALLPTKRRFGCFCTVTGSSGIPSSTSGPRFVAALSSSILCEGTVARSWNAT